MFFGIRLRDAYSHRNLSICATISGHVDGSVSIFFVIFGLMQSCRFGLWLNVTHVTIIFIMILIRDMLYGYLKSNDDVLYW